MMHRVLRIVFAVVALGGIAVAGITYHAQEQTAPACPGCNVILISLDTLGMKHTTLGDPTLSTTPFLAKIASERGIVFSNAYSQAPWSLPSHVAMLTGEYPWTYGIWSTLNQLPEESVTITEALKERGYTTAAFSTGWFVAPRWNTTQGFDSFSGVLEEDGWNDIPSLFTDASEWITKQSPDKPFFVLIRPFGIHDPYGDSAVSTDVIHIHEIAAENMRPDGPSLEVTERFRERYQEDVRATDKALENFFANLEASGLLQHTMIIITSPHGEEFGEHGSVGLHAITTYKEVLQVPLIVIMPQSQARIVSDSVEVRSIPATILDALGYRDSDSPALAPEHSLLASDLYTRVALAGTLFERERYLPTLTMGYQSLEELESLIPPTERTTVSSEMITRSAIQGRWHVIKNQSGEIEIYDMERDPLEQDNLANALYILSAQDRATVTMLQLAILKVK